MERAQIYTEYDGTYQSTGEGVALGIVCLQNGHPDMGSENKLTDRSASSDDMQGQRKRKRRGKCGNAHSSFFGNLVIGPQTVVRGWIGGDVVVTA